MKQLLKIFLLLFVNFIYSQQLETHKLLPPESKEHSDFSFLKDELHNKRLIMLGEMTHGYGNIFEMKCRLVEYLHKELGYTTIAMESSMYDLWLMNEEGFTPKAFNAANWEVWSNSSEFQRLVKYIDDNKIKVMGFDSQVKNTLKFTDDFFDYCERQKIKIRLNKLDMAIVIEGVLESVTYDDSDIEYQDFELELKRIITQIAKLELTELNYHWGQFVKGVLSSSKDAYYNKDAILSTDYGNKQHNFRDEQMADNLLSYMERHKTEKIICWADNIHIINDMSSITKPIIKDFIPMGSYIKKKLKDDVYSLATLHANDSLSEKGIWHPTPILENSFEHELKSFKTPYLFVRSNQEGMRKTKQHRLLDFVDFTDGRLDQLFDGYIFIANATDDNNDLDVSVKSEVFDAPINDGLLNKGESVFLKGKIIDSETKNAIPYANLIFKNAEVYRIADDNGNFELKISKNSLSNDSLSISSMGFETRIIPFKHLSSEIHLTPYYEKLNQVIINAKASPKIILAKAIKKINENHPITPFNSKRYDHIIRNNKDRTISDVEYITKEYDQGYRQSYIATRKYEEIRRNITTSNSQPKKWLVSGGGRENAIQYSNITHKRKSKKFNLEYSTSDRPEDEGVHIISFKSDRNKWNYTNRGYPTHYSGKIFINKDDYAILKIIQTWETTLDEKEIKKYKFWLDENIMRNHFKELKIKEESICTYSKEEDGKYYANTIFNRTYAETIDRNNILENSVFESNSIFFDVSIYNVEEIEYMFGEKNKRLLENVDYNSSFWESFDINNPQKVEK
ncbi:erythromycin esterase family protein [Gelidibacter sp. F2691]|nr:erythromycin esterase family protein [Gelidibacter sp. F2691]